MGGARAAALLARSSSTSSALLSQHLSFGPLLSLRPCRGRASASSVRMASDAAPQKDSSPASAAAASSAGASGSSTSASSSFTSPSSAVDFLTLCHRLKCLDEMSHHFSAGIQIMQSMAFIQHVRQQFLQLECVSGALPSYGVLKDLDIKEMHSCWPAHISISVWNCLFQLVQSYAF